MKKHGFARNRGGARRVCLFCLRLSPCAARFVLGLAVLLCAASCSPILSERAYQAVKIGNSDTFFDDFEDNDGSLSLVYLYQGQGTLTKEWAASGSWSMKIPMNQSLSLVVEPEEDAAFRLVRKYDSSFAFTIDGVQVGFSSSWGEGDQVAETYDVPSGRHTLKLESIWSVVYVDDFSLSYLPAAFSPESDGFLFGEPVFTWPGVSGVEAYELQLSSDQNMETIVLDIVDLQAPTYTPAAALADGNWYWRVRWKRSGFWGFWSPVRHFAKVRTAFTDVVADAAWSFFYGWNHSDVLDLDGGAGGGYAIQFPATTSFSGLYAELKGTISCPCLLCYKTSGGSPGFAIDDIQQSCGPWKASTEGWYDNVVAVKTAGVHRFKFNPVYMPAFRLSDLAILRFVEPAAEGFEGGGLASTGYRLLGAGNATFSSATSRSGSGSLSLAAAAGKAALLAPVRLDAPATLTFYAKNTGPGEHSYLTVSDAGTPLLNAYLGPDWEKYTVELSAGCRALTLEYPQYYSGYTAYVDDLSFE